MIPASLLLSVARQLGPKTSKGEVSWARADYMAETWTAPRDHGGRLQLSFFPSRSGGADSILFEVLDHTGKKVGAIGVSEDEREIYEPLAELLFAIQRKDPGDPSRVITDDLLNILPEGEKAKWVGTLR